MKLSEAIMEYLCYRDRLRELRLFSLEKALGRAQSPFQCLKGLQESCRGSWDKGWRGRTRGNGFPLPQDRDGWDIGKELFPGRVGRPWHRVPRAAVAAPGLRAVPKARLDTGAWSSLGQWEVSLPMAGVGLDELQGPFQLKPSHDSVSPWILLTPGADGQPGHADPASLCCWTCPFVLEPKAGT